MSKKLFVTVLIFLAGLCCLPDSHARQQDSADNGLRNVLTLDDVAKRAENAKSVSELDEATQSTIQQLYELARQQLEFAAQADAELKKFKELANQAQTALKSAQSELEKPANGVTLPEINEFSEAQLQELVRQKNLELTQAREHAKSASTEMARRQARLVELPELISKTEKRLAEIKPQLDAEIPSGESAMLTQARKTQLTAEKQNLEKQLEAYNAERSAYTLTSDLPPLEDQLAQRKSKQLEAEVAAIKARIALLRESEIQKRIREAREAVVQAPAELKPIAEENLRVTEQLEKSSKRIAEVNSIEQRTEQLRVALAKRYDTTKVRVDAIGLSDTLGIMLRQNKYDVLRLRNRNPVDSKLRDEVSTIRAESFKSEDRAEDLADPESVAKTFVSQLNVPETRKADLTKKAESLLELQKQAYGRLTELQNDSFNAIFGLLTEQRRFAKLCSEYSDYIDEHVLWIRSAPVIGAADSGDGQSDIANISEAVREFATPGNWQSVGASIINGAMNRLSMFLVIAFGLVLLFAFHPRLKINIRDSAKIASRRSCRDLSPTATSLLETVLLSFLWPGIIMSIGWLVRSDFTATQFANAFGSGLIAVGLISAPLEFLRQVCRTDGLAEAHFEWPDLARRSIRKNIHWLTLGGVPLLLIVVTMHHLGVEEWNNSLGRLAAIILLGLSALFVFRVFRPGGNLFRGSQNRDSHFYKLRYFRFAVFALGHIALIGFAIAGYYYTTYQLGINLLHSIAAAIGLLTLYSMMLRLLLVRRRRLRYEQLVVQRENLQKQQRLAAEASPEGAAHGKIAEAMDIELQTDVGTDINSVSRQAQELTGVIFLAAALLILWQIWQDVLPATKMLDTVALWPVAVGDKGETEIVSLRDLLFSMGLFLLTFFGVRNIPGMLELLLLKQLPLDSGSRYAITTIFRYFITVVGVILALNFLKIPWSNYSWLVAAISVGLGFGLQEIVANFVSGLIILLERPVRVGDVVTLDGTTGVVSRIQMRATTVTNWDNQELVVPNKDLVTGKLMNWTLTSVVNRVALTVGVAYGTDVDKVQKLIQEVADKNPNVLKEPAPVVSFEEFGDSSLNFKLRCCITALEKRVVIIHELNTGINAAFNREKIVVPFPQRDLHMIKQPDS